MQVNPLRAVGPDMVAGAADTTKVGAGTPSADYNMFLKLLIAQLKNQDPTAADDPTKYVSQLASFSAVEQATQTNKKLDDLFISSLVTQAASYVGKFVTSKDGKIHGKIETVQIFSDGLMAVLTDGTKLILGPGDIISDHEKKLDVAQNEIKATLDNSTTVNDDKKPNLMQLLDSVSAVV